MSTKDKTFEDWLWSDTEYESEQMDQNAIIADMYSREAMDKSYEVDETDYCGECGGPLSGNRFGVSCQDCEEDFVY